MGLGTRLASERWGQEQVRPGKHGARDMSDRKDMRPGTFRKGETRGHRHVQPLKHRAKDTIT